jgi:predicted AAA+ superfamily ATPase
MPRWKDILKSYFDKHEAEARFLVTGSARLDWFRRSGDSLAGRYFLFRLNPLTLSEAAGSLLAEPAPSESAHEFMEKKAGRVRYEEEALSQLLNYSGFPEPFLKADAPFYRRWQRDMVDRLTREDVRDLTRILDVEHVATLMQILPDRIGSPLSLNALREDIGIGYSAVRSAISALQLTYAFFLISPYSRNIARTVKKEKKGYFFDWGRCTDPAKRFENYVGCELKALTDLWHDKGIGDFSLMYVRSRDGKETDFLVTRNNEPWCLFEAKIEDGSIPSHHFHHAQVLGDIPLILVVQKGRVFRKQDRTAYRISASRFFA